MNTLIQKQLHTGAIPQTKVQSWGRGLTNPHQDPLNFVVAGCLSALLLCVAVAAKPEVLGWHLLPLFLCGVLIGIDMVAYVRGKLDTFDPMGVLGIFGYYFFFLAPLLTLVTEYHSKFLPLVLDWTDWIGWVSAINALGLFLYVAVRRLFPVRRPSTIWLVRRPSFFTAISIALPTTLVCQVLIFVSFGGILGFMDTFSNRDTEVFTGMGYMFLIAEMFPVFFAIAFLVWKRDQLRCGSWWYLALLTGAFFALKLICGGLRGSRSITVWGLFWMIGAIHVWIRPVPRKALVAGFIFVLAFMYIYGFYKDVGVGAFEILEDRSKIESLENNSGRTMDAVLLGDMARTEVQATVLSRISTSSDFQYAYGMTYIQAFTFMIPKAIWPDRPEGKVKAGTEAIFGRGVYERRLMRASYIYGLVGEAMLNFPPVFAPLGFVAIAFILSKARSLMLADPDDLRLLLLPVCAYGMVLLVMSDLDNVLFASLSIAMAPLIMIRSCCRCVPRVS